MSTAATEATKRRKRNGRKNPLAGFSATVEEQSALDQYLRDVSRHELITPDREKELGALAQKGDEDAIQELARVSSQRAAPSSIRIRVDVGGYRTQRAAALAHFARKAADKAIDNAAEVSLEPMSPADRKSVHDALSEDDRVETRSVGTEPRRRIIVIPTVDASAAESEEE